MHVLLISCWIAMPFLGQDPKPDDLKRDIERAIQDLASDQYVASWQARTDLVEIGREAVPYLLTALKDEKSAPMVRHMICEILGAIRDNRKEVVDALVAALDDKGDYGTSVASAAAAALAWVGEKSAAPSLLKTLQDKRTDTDKPLKYECIRALGIFRSKEAVETLRKALEDKKTTAVDPHEEGAHTIAAEAAAALGKIRSSEAVDDLGKILGDYTTDSFSEHTLAWHAAKALQRILWDEIEAKDKKDVKLQSLDGPEKDEVDPGKTTAVRKTMDAWKTWYDVDYKGKKNVGDTNDKLKKVHDAVEAFRKDQGRLPATLTDLISKPPDAKTWPEKGYFSAAADPKKTFEDAWGRELKYQSPGTGADFDVFSLGADGLPWGGALNADLYDHDKWIATKQTQNKEKLDEVVKVLQQFKADNDRYPEFLRDLQVKPTYPLKKWEKAYLDKDPRDAFDHPFRYVRKGDAFELISYGADKAEGGEGVFADLKYPAAEEKKDGSK